MGAIATAESGGWPGNNMLAVSPTGDLCGWQINEATWRGKGPWAGHGRSWIFEPINCADEARYVKAHSINGVGAWATFANGLLGPKGHVDQQLAQRIRRAWRSGGGPP